MTIISTGGPERITVTPDADNLVCIAPENQEDDGSWSCSVAYSIPPAAARELAAALIAAAEEVAGP